MDDLMSKFSEVILQSFAAEARLEEEFKVRWLMFCWVVGEQRERGATPRGGGGFLLESVPRRNEHLSGGTSGREGERV